MLPTETGDSSVSRRSRIASADRFRTEGACWSEPMHDTDRASDASVAILADTGRVPFRGARFDRFCGARQDRLHSAAVTRQSFTRPKAPSYR